MYEEIPTWKCWHKEGLVPPDAGTMCLRSLVNELNKEDSPSQDSSTELVLQLYALSSNVEDTSIRCKVGGCEATFEIDPVDILANWSKSR